jgi:hypothetical protein
MPFLHQRYILVACLFHQRHPESHPGGGRSCHISSLHATVLNKYFNVLTREPHALSSNAIVWEATFLQPTAERRGVNIEDFRGFLFRQ